MGQLENMALFIGIVEAGSITAAAGRFDLAKSAVSKRLRELETALGTRLLNRTTRRSSLTEAGSLYYRRAKLILGEVEDLNCELSSRTQTLEGSLKLAVPLSFGLTHLTPVLDEFASSHPELKLNLDFSDRKVDIVEEGYDLAIRIGHLADSSMQVRKIAPIREVLCASPGYLEKHGRPTTPAQLRNHRFLRYGNAALSGIRLRDGQGADHLIQLDAGVVANNGDFLNSMAISGHGIVQLPTFIAWDGLTAGSLEVVLPGYTVTPLQAYAMYPPTRHLPLKVRSLIDFLVARFGATPYWDKGID